MANLTLPSNPLLTDSPTIESIRGHCLKSGPIGKGPVVYWLSRDSRLQDNEAFQRAFMESDNIRRPLQVLFCLAPLFPNGSPRSYDPLFAGLQEVEFECRTRNIGFQVLFGNPAQTLPKLFKDLDPAMLITDFSPMIHHRIWLKEISQQISCPMIRVDAHNIVPCWHVSPKEEIGARTLRPKLAKLLPDFLRPFPILPDSPKVSHSELPKIDWTQLWTFLGEMPQIQPIDYLAGATGGKDLLWNFLNLHLDSYRETRNDPSKQGQSGLSPWLHFGHLSPRRIALEAWLADVSPESKFAFLEELIVRRELADNYCFYNLNAGQIAGIPLWAKASLERHKDDPRPYSYSLEELRLGNTHDPAWNAAQRQLVTTGKMHGYMRMYWAKQLLLWEKSPKEAFELALYFNDLYSLDGRDPNGITGVGWSIGGLHDRPWNERPVYGSIRSMVYSGLKKKFPIETYINLYITSED